MKQKKTIVQDQAGMVSIIVTMVLMLVISLIVLGFAQNARREQRQALDTQLSTQAFYAAESAINDAKQAIIGGGFSGNKTTCPTTPQFNGTVNATYNVSYTCLLIDQAPGDLQYSPVNAGQSISADMTFQGGATAASIVITWSAASGNTTFRNSADTVLPPTGGGAGSWGASAALLRMELTNFGVAPTDYSRGNLQNTTFTSFLYPVTNGGSGTVAFPATPVNPASQGQMTSAVCTPASPTSTGSCTITITNVNSSHVFLQLGSIYADSHFTISAIGTGAGNPPLNIVGAQAVIDATGKAQDVLRRIQVRLPLDGQGSATQYAVESVTGICKDIVVAPNFGEQTPSSSGPCALP